MIKSVVCASIVCLSAVALPAQQSQSRAASAPQVGLLSVTRPAKVFIAGKGDSSGNWLKVRVKVTPPSSGFTVEKLGLVAKNGDMLKPVALTGAASKGKEVFLGVKDQPGVLEHWARLRSKEGTYFGAGYMDANQQLTFIWSADGKLILQGVSPASVSLLFEVPASPTSYRLVIGESQIDLPRSIK